MEKKCYIWTRVSTKYQENNGGSLDDQKQKCETFAKEHNYAIVDYFGGTHESAKTPGKLINEMIKAIKKNREATHIIISQADRFSRNAGQGISILNELVKNNITVVEAISGLDTSTPEGLMMMQVKICMSQWDNTNRTNKFQSGINHCFECGIFIGKSPVGYDKSGKSINTQYTINEKGLLIRKAFKWKLQGMCNFEIINKLETYGYHVSKQTLHKILTNPFYAGKIVHKRLHYKIVDGKHPAIISYEEFLRVQKILSGKTGVYQHQKETPQYPLKHYVRCSIDNTPFTGYTKKGIVYYKCNKTGCKTNVSAKSMHKKYSEILDTFQIPTNMIDLVKQVISNKIGEDDMETKEELTLLKKNKTEIENRIKNIKLRFAEGTIEEDIYQIGIQDNQNKLDNILLEIDKANSKLSNSQKDVDDILVICCSLGSLWKETSLQTCQKLQNLIFPNGILWDKKIGNYRTIEINQALELIVNISNTCIKTNEGNKPSSVNLCG